MLHIITKALALASAVSAVIVTTGATGGTQMRRECRELAKSKRDWDLYLQAWEALQAVSQNSPTGYYGLAAIHGVPGGSYDGSRGNPRVPNNCPHDGCHFGPWHRPYMALFEQQLQQQALTVARQYPSSTRADYVARAQKLRLCFWDWTQADGGSAFPTMYSDQSVTVDTPKGTRTINNPLRRYKFHPNAHGLGIANFSDAKYTNRAPTDPFNLNSPSRQNVVRANVQRNRAQWNDRVHKLLTMYHEFRYVTNEGWIANSAPNLQDSFETVHDAVHGASGDNNGFMTLIYLSSYDPLFWMHHCMIDRLIALWQALNKKAWMVDCPNDQGSTFWFNRGSTATASQGLVPFKKNARGDYWNANDIRKWTVFGYNYPETPQGPDTPTNVVRAAVDRLYGRDQSGEIDENTPPRIPPAMMLRGRFVGDKRDGTNSTAHAKYEYWVNYIALKNALPKPYYITLFLGEPGEDVSKWLDSPNFVTFQPIVPSLSSPGETPAKVQVVGQLQLNRAIEAKIKAREIKNADDATIQTYLKEHLTWRVSDSDGKTHDPADVEGLQLSVGNTVYDQANKAKDDGEAHADGFIASAAGGNAASADPGWKSNLLEDVFKHKKGALQDSGLYHWGHSNDL